MKLHNNSELENILAIENFLKDNGIKRMDSVTQFSAEVEYQYQGRTVQGYAEIRIHRRAGMRDGNIEIMSPDFEPFDVHTEFSPRFQSYTYDEKKKRLRIRGNSKKMQGEYFVSIDC